MNKIARTFVLILAFVFVLTTMGLPKVHAAGVNLIPTTPGTAPDYFSTWNIQGYITSYTSSKDERDAMKESNMFGTGKYQNWVGFFPRIRSDLTFVMDDSWDVDFTNYDYGTDTLNATRFPTYASLGTEADKLKSINTAVKNKGWRNIGGWVAANKSKASGSTSNQDYYTKILKDMNTAGWGYWKVDWGTYSRDTGWRQNLTNWAHTYAPNLTVEHALAWDSVPFADAFRTYDVEVITSIPVTLSRVSKGIQYVADAGAKGIINSEDEPIIGAALGTAIGIMRHPFTGNLPNGKPDFAFPAVTRDVKNSIDEVNRGVLWHRVAPPFKVDGNVNIDSTQLKDSWYFLANEGWNTGANTWSYNSAPARITRGGLPLPTVNVASGEKPYVVASRNPNGALTIASLPRTISYSTTDRRYWTPLADITLNTGGLTGPIGIFGKYNSLTLTFDSPISGSTILAQDILDTQSTDITSQVSINGNSMTLSGALINQIGLSKATSGDKSDPGMVISIKKPASAFPDTTANYRIINRNSGKALDIKDDSTADGANIVQRTVDGGNSQKFQFIDAGNGYYRIQNIFSGKALDIKDDLTADGAYIVQRTVDGGNSQKFQFIDTYNGYYKTKNFFSGKLMDISGASTADGAQDIQWTDNGGLNQQWSIVKVN